MKLSTLTIILQLFALILIMTFILFVILAQAHLHSYPVYLFTPTPNIDTTP